MQRELLRPLRLGERSMFTCTAPVPVEGQFDALDVSAPSRKMSRTSRLSLNDLSHIILRHISLMTASGACRPSRTRPSRNREQSSNNIQSTGYHRDEAILFPEVTTWTRWYDMFNAYKEAAICALCLSITLLRPLIMAIVRLWMAD